MSHHKVQLKIYDSIVYYKICNTVAMYSKSFTQTAVFQEAAKLQKKT